MLICDNCSKPAEQNHSKTEISSRRDDKGFKIKIDLCEECFDSFVTFKVYLSKKLEFFSKMSYCRGLAYLSGTSKQEWFSHRIVLPLQEFYVYISLYIFLHGEK